MHYDVIAICMRAQLDRARVCRRLVVVVFVQQRRIESVQIDCQARERRLWHRVIHVAVFRDAINAPHEIEIRRRLKLPWRREAAAISTEMHHVRRVESLIDKVFVRAANDLILPFSVAALRWQQRRLDARHVKPIDLFVVSIDPAGRSAVAPHTHCAQHAVIVAPRCKRGISRQDGIADFRRHWQFRSNRHDLDLELRGREVVAVVSKRKIVEYDVRNAAPCRAVHAERCLHSLVRHLICSAEMHAEVFRKSVARDDRFDIAATRVIDEVRAGPDPPHAGYRTAAQHKRECRVIRKRCCL